MLVRVYTNATQHNHSVPLRFRAVRACVFRGFLSALATFETLLNTGIDYYEYNNQLNRKQMLVKAYRFENNLWGLDYMRLRANAVLLRSRLMQWFYAVG